MHEGYLQSYFPSQEEKKKKCQPDFVIFVSCPDPDAAVLLLASSAGGVERSDLVQEVVRVGVIAAGTGRVAASYSVKKKIEIEYKGSWEMRGDYKRNDE